jgi:hypothetical protein
LVRFFVEDEMHTYAFSTRASAGIGVLVLMAFLPFQLVAQECSHGNDELSANPPTVIVQGTGGLTVFTLDNVPAADVLLKLSAGPFVSQAAQSVIAGSVTFGAGDGSGELPKTLSRVANPPIKVTVSNEPALGLATAKIFNNGRCMGWLKAVRFDAPLSFSAEWDGPPNSPLRIEDGKPVRITIKNNDDTTYAVTPVLSVNGEESPAGDIVFGPNARADVRFHTNPSWFGVATFLRPNPEQARMELRPTPSSFGDALGSRAIAGRSIVVSTQISYFHSFWSAVVSTIVVFVVLLLGGLASVATSSVLPTVLRRLSYKKRLRTLADATSAISVKVDSRLRVLLRLERNRLLKLLAASSSVSTDTNDIFQQVDAGIAALGKRVTVAQRLDALRNRFDRESLSCPSSVSDSTDRHLQDAADQVRTKSLTDAMIENANRSLDAAEQILNGLGNTDALGRDIAARHKELLARLATFPAALVSKLEQDLPGIFAVRSQVCDDAHPVSVSNFVQVDDSIARINAALDYAYIQASTADSTIQERLSLRYPKLVQLLGTRDWRSLRAARDLVEQMRQNIYPEDLVKDLRAKRATITIDQQTARPYMPLEFCICFSQQSYNRGRALEQLTCTWRFDDAGEKGAGEKGAGEKDDRTAAEVSLSETGWEVCHFYQDPNLKIVTAEIPLDAASLLPVSTAVQAAVVSTATAVAPSASGVASLAPPPGSSPSSGQNTAPASPSGTVTFTRQIQVRDARTSFIKQERVATILRFAIAFFFALIGLMSGAQEQLAKLDVLPGLIAVFLLGFGADTIKNILTQQASPATVAGTR